MHPHILRPQPFLLEGRRAPPPAQTAHSMFILSILLGTSLVTSGSDSVKKKASDKAPAPKPSAVVQTGAPASPASAPKQKTLLGKAIERSIANTARAVSPRASYLS